MNVVTVKVELDLDTPYIPPAVPSGADGLLAVLAGVQRDRASGPGCLDPLPQGLLPVATGGGPGREWYRVSALLPGEECRVTLVPFTKRFHVQQSDLIWCKNPLAVSLARGPLRNWYGTLVAVAIRRLFFLADVPEERLGDFARLARRLKGRCVGKKAAWGFGRVAHVIVGYADPGWTAIRHPDGWALRPIPADQADRYDVKGPRAAAAFQPPYWAQHREECVIPPLELWGFPLAW